MLDKLQKQVCRTVAPTLRILGSSSKNVASLVLALRMLSELAENGPIHYRLPDIVTLTGCVIYQGIIQGVFEIGNCFWAHKNWHPNFDKLTKNKIFTKALINKHRASHKLPPCI